MRSVSNTQSGPAVGGGQHISRADAAKRLGCSVRFLERLAQDGGGPQFLRLGKKVVYPVNGIDAWSTSRLVKSTSEGMAA